MTYPIHVSIDNHLSSYDCHYAPARATVEEYRSFLQRVRPKRLNVFAVGHDGHAQYPSAFVPRPAGLETDMLELWRTVTRMEGVEFYVYISTLRNDMLLRQRPEWCRISYSGAHVERVDHNTPYLDEFLIPLLTEIIERYDPDGFFFDGDYWTVCDSWNACSTEKFERETGLKTPTNTLSPTYPCFREFTMRTYWDYNRRLGAFLAGQKRRLGCSINVGFTFRDPRPLPPGITLITGDLPPFFGLLDAVFEASVHRPREVDADIVLPLFVEPEGHGRKQAKSSAQLFQELGVLAAGSFIPHVYFPAGGNGEIASDYVNLVGGALQVFFGERPGLAEAGRYSTRPEIGILNDLSHVSLTQDLRGVRGAALAGIMLHWNFALFDAESLLEALDGLSVVIVPEPERLTESLLHGLTHFLYRGGLVVISPALLLHSANVRAWLAANDVCVEEEARHVRERMIPLYGELVEITGPFFLANGQDVEQGGLLSMRTVGKGTLAVLNGTPFIGFNERPSRTFRHFMSLVIAPAHRSSPWSWIDVSAPDYVYCRFTAGDEGRYRLHVCNLAHGTWMLGRHVHYESVPPAGPITVRISGKQVLSSAVGPGTTAVETEQMGHDTTFVLTGVRLHAMLDLVVAPD